MIWKKDDYRYVQESPKNLDTMTNSFRFRQSSAL